MNKWLSFAVILVGLTLLLPGELSAQYGKKKKRRDEEIKTEKTISPIWNKLWYGVNIGNPGISSNFFSLGLGPMVAYKFNNSLSAGIITDLNYTYFYSRFSPNESYIDYAVGVFGRARFLRTFYAHAEYNMTSLDRASAFEDRSNFPVMYLGGGYTSGRAPWGFEATLLFDVLGNLQQYRIPIVYRIGVTYNF